MNRNVESHFSELPKADIQRSRFDRSHSVKFTMNVGELVPFLVEEVLPGDTFQISTSKVLRLQTLLHPLMDNMYLDSYFFFVPNRLVWSHWQEFCGENTSSAWLPDVEYSVPTSFDTVEVGDIADYMGVPVGKSLSFNSLPLRAYGLICNDWFRDENLTDPLNLYFGDASHSVVNTIGFKTPFKVSKYHDYFTSCLPAPQKGPDVSLSFFANSSSTAPVFAAPGAMDMSDKAHRNPISFSAISPNGNLVDSNNYYVYAGGNTTGSLTFDTKTDGHNRLFVPNNLYAEFDRAFIGINELRMAFQVQKYYEKLARGGSRYIEILKSMFGVTSPDSRLQRPEYLGGNRVPLTIHQVVNQAESAEESSGTLGNLGAYSFTHDRHDDFVKSFVEHGFVIGVCCIRYDHTYSQGLDRFWSRSSKFDYYWPVFANIGEQPVKNREIYAGTDKDSEVFGYQEAWADYRYKPNRVAGEMRPGISNSLASWHLGDYYSSMPFLSDSWIREDKAPVDRALAVTSSVSQQVLVDFYIKNIATRPMPMYSIPGLIDHH